MIAKVIPAKAGGRTTVVCYVGREDMVDLTTGEVTAKAIAIETQGVASLRLPSRCLVA
ncbi:MAG: hypothetical protein M3R51_06360 [Candidatus Eremiobacteraeota bacterium]|nr:hypothetical protein [Candidatus Eremiobacteraeota bacterium]